jgi:hypothetical protein
MIKDIAVQRWANRKRRLWNRIHRLAYPGYACERCVGQDEWQGCYCAYYGACGPNNEPECGWLTRLARWYVDRKQRGKDDAQD